MRIILNLLLLLTISCVTNKTYKTSSSTHSIPSEQVEAPSPSALFHTEINYEWAKELVNTSNCIWKLPEFRKEIESMVAFDYSDKTGKEVVKALNGGKCGLRVYKTKNPWSSAIATTYATDKEYLYLNLRKNPRELAPMVNTMMHECTHLVGFSHGDNYAKGKELSVPYWIGNTAEKYVHKCK